jgi:hypothetical protein
VEGSGSGLVRGGVPHLSGDAVERRKRKPGHDSRCLSRDSIWPPPEHKSETLLLEPSLLMNSYWSVLWLDVNGNHNRCSEDGRYWDQEDNNVKQNSHT